jgi:hypothetical protein
MSEARLNRAKKVSLTKNRGRPKKANKRSIRVSFRLTWAEYKTLLEKCGSPRKLSAWIRKKLGVE